VCARCCARLPVATAAPRALRALLLRLPMAATAVARALLLLLRNVNTHTACGLRLARSERALASSQPAALRTCVHPQQNMFDAAAPDETPVDDVLAFIKRVWPSLDVTKRRRLTTAVHGIAKRGRGFRYRPGLVSDPNWRPTKHQTAALQGLKLIESADTRVVRHERTSGEAAFPFKVMVLELVSHAPGEDQSTTTTTASRTVSLSMMYVDLLSRLVEDTQCVRTHVREVKERGVLVWHGARDGVASLSRSRGSGVACDQTGIEMLQAAAREMRARIEVVVA